MCCAAIYLKVYPSFSKAHTDFARVFRWPCRYSNQSSVVLHRTKLELNVWDSIKMPFQFRRYGALIALKSSDGSLFATDGTFTLPTKSPNTPLVVNFPALYRVVGPTN